MTEYFEQFTDWITRIAAKHNVDPLIWGALFVTGKVLFILSVGWALKNVRAQKGTLVPLFFSSLSYSLQHIYVIIAGRDIPLWIYLLMTALFVFGSLTAWRKISDKRKTESTSASL